MTLLGVTQYVREDTAIVWLKHPPQPSVYLGHLRTDCRYMTNRPATPTGVWTVAEAKARLSEVLRLAEEAGPQRIGTRKPFVVVPAAVWEEKTRPRKPLGQWLVENVPRGTNLEVPDRSSRRPIPFIDETGE